LSFKHAPFNPVDALIFCQLSYLPFENIVPAQGGEISISSAARAFAAKQKENVLGGYVIFKDDPEFLKTLGASKRYEDCKMLRFVNNIDAAQEKQFSAICIHTGDLTFIAYRGTDVTLVGWKEDLNMSFIDAVPSQLEAVSYLETAAHNITGPLLIGGHSKGGNLAVYAASMCARETREKINAVYSFDAPGFHQHLVESEGFAEIRERINLYIPQSSVVGLLFEHGKDSAVVQSSETGLLQHELYSWQLTHNDMVRLDTITLGSRYVDKTLREWIGGMDYERRKDFSEALFAILNATQAKSLFDLGTDWFKTAGRMIQSLGNVDNATKKVIRRTIAALFEAAKNNFSTLLQPKETQEPQGSNGARDTPKNKKTNRRK